MLSRRFTNTSLTLSGETLFYQTSSLIRAISNGNATWKAFTETCKRIYLMLLTGDLHTVSGPAKHSLVLPLIHNGFTWALTPYPSTTSSQDSRASTLNKSWPMLMTSILPSAIGCMKSPLIKSGIFLKRCPDGWDGTMVATVFWLISQKLDGTMYLTVDSTLSPTQLMVNTLQNMSTTTTCTLTLTKSQERKEAKKVLLTVSSSQLVNSHPRTNGSENLTPH